MKTTLKLLALVLFGILYCCTLSKQKSVHAQAVGPWQVTVANGPAASCTPTPASAIPHYDYCFSSDKGLLQSNNGAAFVVVGVQVAPVIGTFTLNPGNKVCNLAAGNCTITLVTQGPTITATSTAPPITAQ